MPTASRASGGSRRFAAALDRWGKGDPSGFLEICAPEVVYFDPGLERRIDGLEALTRYYEGLRGTIHFERFELVNPLVQVVGDAAILTFNYASYGTEGVPYAIGPRAVRWFSRRSPSPTTLERGKAVGCI